jgi:CDP-glucose 4,6-dehydratase
VCRSYHDPVSTFAVNALGTAHVLEAARGVPSVKGVVCITTDKVYQNNEGALPFCETDPLGGKDPYSASKAAAEMVIGSYMASYGKTDGTGLAIATARGGNIIGGGDWSEDRLIPDFVRALINHEKLTLRYPDAIRPWQHVLALVQGYLMLLAGLIERPADCVQAWNFGPLEARNYSVREVLNILSESWQAPQIDYMDHPLPEAHTLTLDSSRARNLLGWIPAWDTKRMITETIGWYRGYYAQPELVRDLTINQLKMWRSALHQRG